MWSPRPSCWRSVRTDPCPCVAALVSIPLSTFPRRASPPSPSCTGRWGTPITAREARARPVRAVGCEGPLLGTMPARSGSGHERDPGSRTVNLAGWDSSAAPCCCLERCSRLQSVADSSDPVRRRRASAPSPPGGVRREPTVDMEVVEQENEQPGQTVDGKLSAWSGTGGVLLTNDGNWPRCRGPGRAVRSIHALAEAVGRGSWGERSSGCL